MIERNKHVPRSLIKPGLWLLGILALGLGSYLFFVGEDIALLAIDRCEVGAPPESASAKPAVIATLEPGQTVKVLGCESTKSDIEIAVRLDSGATGVVVSGDYRLQRKPASLRSVLSGAAVLSCQGMLAPISERL